MDTFTKAKAPFLYQDAQGPTQHRSGNRNLVILAYCSAAAAAFLLVRGGLFQFHSRVAMDNSGSNFTTTVDDFDWYAVRLQA